LAHVFYYFRKKIASKCIFSRIVMQKA